MSEFSLKKNRFCHFLPIFGIPFLIVLAGCVRLEIQTDPLSRPPMQHAIASEYKGLPLSALAIVAGQTLYKAPMHTQLIREVAENSAPAVVSVYIKTKGPLRITIPPIPLPGAGGMPIRVPGEGLGSGFIIHPSGLLLTNNHVIERADQVKVRMQDGTDYNAIIIARDPAFDLALLKITDGVPPFPVLPMGDSERVDAGNMVIAVGNPLGLGHTVTFGIISHTGRELSPEKDANRRHVRYIQTDTAINPGSSGGPLITLAGAWIGINTAGARFSQGIGFAVPSSQVKAFLDMIRKGAWDGESP